jgi:CBS domain-containing protein
MRCRREASSRETAMSTVREAMVSNPGQLPADASAQAAGELLQRTEVRAVYVTEDERLVGVVTRKTLVREVIANGLDPSSTELRAIAETPHLTIGPDIPLEEAFRFLEAEDAERVPVVDEHHRLVGVLSRSVLQRRLAEDEGEDEPLPPAA